MTLAAACRSPVYSIANVRADRIGKGRAEKREKKRKEMKEKTAGKTPEKQNTKPANKLGYVVILLAAFLYASQSPITKIFLAWGYTSYDITTILFVMSALVVNLTILVTGRFGIYKDIIRNWKLAVTLSLIQFVQFASYFLVLKYLDANLAIVLMYLSPTLICIFFLVTKIKPVGTANKIAVVLSLLGTMLAVNIFNGDIFAGSALIGVVLAVLVAVLGATNQIVTDLKGGNIGAIPLMTAELTIGSFIAVATNFDAVLMMGTMGAAHLSYFFLTTVFTKVLSLLCVLRGILMIGSEKASVGMVAEVPFTLVLCYFSLGETMTPVQLIGVAAIIVAVVLLQKESGPAEDKAGAPKE